MTKYTMELLRRGFEEVEPYDFYREIFGDDQLDEEGAFTPGKYVGIAVEVTKAKKADGSPLIRRHNIYDDFGTIDLLIYTDNFCITSPISYAGKSRSSENARFMYALCIELDNLIEKKGKPEGLARLINQWSDRVHWIPRPTFVVSSGSGLHLYYQFREAVPMYPDVVKQLKRLKRELTEMIWNRHTTTSHKKEDIQQESIFQGFRMPGTVTKKGDRATAHRVGDKVTLEYLNKFVKEANRVTPVYKSPMSLREAKAKYPEWYERRVVQKKPRGQWATNRAVYEWWKQRIFNEAVVGHRYYCMMLLVVYAIKCSVYDAEKNPRPVTREELEKDCLELLEVFDERSDTDTNRFTEKDVLDALQAWDEKELYTYPINSIVNRSGLIVTPNKRNHRKQADHVQLMNSMKQLKKQLGEYKGDGRPAGQSKERDAVIQWRQENPTGTKAACARETGISKPTVYRWWDAQPEIIERPRTLEELDALMEGRDEATPTRQGAIAWDDLPF